jgi:hypothetical protein
MVNVATGPPDFTSAVSVPASNLGVAVQLAL